MDAVPIFNDLVGGVEVEVLHDFTGIDDTLIKGEKVILMGEQALRYVRSRKGVEDSSNTSRMERQQQYVYALYEATKKSMESNPDFIVDASVSMTDYTVSDFARDRKANLKRFYFCFNIIHGQNFRIRSFAFFIDITKLFILF